MGCECVAVVVVDVTVKVVLYMSLGGGGDHWAVVRALRSGVKKAIATGDGDSSCSAYSAGGCMRWHVELKVATPSLQEEEMHGAGCSALAIVSTTFIILENSREVD
ncbi:hypothetical protein ACLB2K_034312 [Fragaria x ananassa]